MGAKLTKFGKLVTDFVKSQAGNEAMKEFTGPLAELGTEVQKVTMEIGQKAMKNADEVGAASVAYMCLVGHFVYSFLWAKMASIAIEKQAEEDFYKSKLLTARFYFAKLLPETAMHLKTIRSGSESLMAMEVACF
jgi:hypothetical protein